MIAKTPLNTNSSEKLAMGGKLVYTALILSSLILLSDAVCKDSSTLTSDEKNILELHNKYRQKHNNTADLCYGVSGDDVTFTASSMSISEYTRHSTEKTFGENMGNTGSYTGWFSNSEASKNVIDRWYKDKGTSEYKQVVWRNTTQVNCGYGTSRDKIAIGQQISASYIYWTFLFCQYYPPGNKNAGATYIGNDTANIGELLPVPCDKPTVKFGTVKPDSATLNTDQNYTVTCNEGYVLKGSSSGNLTCNYNGTLSNVQSVSCGEIPKNDTDKGAGGYAGRCANLSMFVAIFAVLGRLFV